MLLSGPRGNGALASAEGAREQTRTAWPVHRKSAHLELLQAVGRPSRQLLPTENEIWPAPANAERIAVRKAERCWLPRGDGIHFRVSAALTIPDGRAELCTSRSRSSSPVISNRRLAGVALDDSSGRGSDA